jgi:type IV pilus assembly protein PilX
MMPMAALSPLDLLAIRPAGARAHQRGAALVTGLVFLVLMTLIAAVAMRQSIMQERMAGGLRNASLARNGAESALRRAERTIYDYYLTSNGAALVGDVNVSQGVYLFEYSGTRSTVDNFRTYDGYTTAGGTVYDTGTYDFTDTSVAGTAALAEQPVFLIEDLGRMRPPGSGVAGEGGSTGKEGYEGSGSVSPAGNSDIRVYRVTGRSTGGLASVVRVTESTFAGRAKG